MLSLGGFLVSKTNYLRQGKHNEQQKFILW